MRRAVFFSSVAALLFVAIAACVGDDPTTTDPGAGGTLDAGISETGVPNLAPDAAPPANCPLDCLPPAPAGWSGPNAVYDGTPGGKPAACPPQYTQKKVESATGATAAPATCACNAPAFAGAKCAANVEVHSGTTCTNATPLLQGQLLVPGSPCVEVTQGTGRLTVTTATLTTPGTCTFPDAGVATLPPVAFDKVQVSCALPVNASCKDRGDCVASPIPQAPFTRLCIHKDGDESCPSADYAARFVAHKGIADTRGCTGCSGVPAGGGCGTKWGLVGSQTTCETGIPPSTQNANDCVVQSLGQWVNGANLAPTGQQCNVTDGGLPTGVATPIEPITFCCNN